MLFASCARGYEIQMREDTNARRYKCASMLSSEAIVDYSILILFCSFRQRKTSDSNVNGFLFRQ